MKRTGRTERDRRVQHARDDRTKMDGWMVRAAQQSNTATPAIATSTTTQLQILYSTINFTIHISTKL